MEREIQVISPGALGNAMQPGQCPPQPRRLCAKWKNFGRGNGTAAGGPSSCPGVESPQEGPQHPRGPQHPWGSPESMGSPLGHGTHGNVDAPIHRGGRSGHQAPSLPARKRPPRTHGDIAGPGTPSLRTGLGTPKIWWLPSGTEHLPSRQLLLLMLIRASPAGGGSGVKSVLKGAFVSRSRAAGLGCSEHPSFAFPSFFLCLPGAERRRCGGCQALGAPAFVPGRC